MKYTDVFQLVSEEFEKEKIPCVLVGGYVVNYYQYTRATVDIDFLINDQDIEKAKKLLTEAGYKLFNEKEGFAQFEGDGKKFIDLDLILVDRNTLEKIILEGQKAIISGKEFIVPSLFHLIALKLHAIKSDPANREMQDLLDIVSVIKKNKVDVRSNQFKELCLKYGNDQIYSKILNSIL